MDNIIHQIVTNPLVLGAIISFILKQGHEMLAKLDASGTLAKFGPQLHIAYLVLAFLTSAVSLAAQGKLEQVDTTSIEQFITYWITVVIGGKAMEPIVTPKKK